MYHRFGENKYPSTNIREEQLVSHLEYLKDPLNILDGLLIALRVYLLRDTYFHQIDDTLEYYLELYHSHLLHRMY